MFVEKDLGVHIDSELNFEEQICTKARVANAIVGLIRRSFTHLDANSFKKLFCSIVRPHLEYAQCVWSPHLLKHIDLLEKVQERATKLVDGLQHGEYEDRLSKLKITTLAFRRLRGDVIEMFKHFKTYDKTALTPPSFKPRTRPSRKHKFQIQQQRGERRSVLRNTFYHRVAQAWNELPREVVEVDDVNTFKNRLDESWKNHPMKYDHRYTAKTESS